MQMRRFDEAGVTVLEVEGTVRLGESAQQFASELGNIFESTRGGVVIDFAHIDYLDSTGIGELVGYLQKFTRANRRVALFRPHHRMESLLKLTRLDTIFPVFWDRDEAVSFVQGASTQR
ncbi:MAG: STAS domain-containing protein [Thermoanaerobaculaceae bacterium]|nr:STAS domain-containing protein [Thermoanaerobaculaceae bacterium]MDI9621046.1 STAS domain-containing protein [Acidobacteriota bacterium]NLH10395.1 STAS domain-containing protein [Holophagae bacterium]HPW55839.1 STAS domain-containing protein [Thermoanaerobaculaceae bacterium]